MHVSGSAAVADSLTTALRRSWSLMDCEMKKLGVIDVIACWVKSMVRVIDVLDGVCESLNASVSCR